MGTGFSDAMISEGSGNTPKHSAASDRPYGYGHPKYDPHLAQRNPLTRGISNEHLLKGQSDELSDATVLGGASSGLLPGNSSALVPSRQASGAVDANKWAVSPCVSVCSWVLWSGLGNLVQLLLLLCCMDGDSVRLSLGCC